MTVYNVESQAIISVEKKEKKYAGITFSYMYFSNPGVGFFSHYFFSI